MPIGQTRGSNNPGSVDSLDTDRIIESMRVSKIENEFNRKGLLHVSAA